MLDCSKFYTISKNVCQEIKNKELTKINLSLLKSPHPRLLSHTVGEENRRIFSSSLLSQSLDGGESKMAS